MGRVCVEGDIMTNERGGRKRRERKTNQEKREGRRRLCSLSLSDSLSARLDFSEMKTARDSGERDGYI